MPAHPSSLTELLWCQIEAPVPPVEDHLPLGCHRLRITDRVVFNKRIRASSGDKGLSSARRRR